MTKEELIDFTDWLKQATKDIVIPYKTEVIVNSYLKSINSTRRSERRADGSNSKAKEVCPRTGFCDIYEQWGFCPYQCALFNRGQTD